VAFSMLQPVTTSPVSVSSAAPTLKCEKPAAAVARVDRGGDERAVVVGKTAEVERHGLPCAVVAAIGARSAIGLAALLVRPAIPFGPAAILQAAIGAGAAVARSAVALGDAAVALPAVVRSGQ
jgi:hypothetical protein